MYNQLTPEEYDVIINKKTERPYYNQYDQHFKEGIYVCKQCDQPLFSSKAKFDAGCGWPAFDACFKDAIEEVPMKYFRWSEIICSNCKGHLGHIFKGEGFTETNTRHCANSLSIKFIPKEETNS